MEHLIAKADVLLEALPYLQRFAGAVVVVKYGGSFMDSPDATVREGVAQDVVLMRMLGLRPVVVHGGGKAITRAMEKSGLKANFVQGMRVTDADTMRIVEQALSREINPDIVAALQRLGGLARGFSGTEVFRCEKLLLESNDGARIDLGFVGDVTSVDAARLQDAIHSGFIPVVSPTALGPDGQIYNCNADVAAAQAAIALKAKRLVFMSDVPGLMRDPKAPATLIPLLAAGDVAGLQQSGVIDKGMIPKMNSAVAALRAGVESVSLVDGRLRHAALLEMFDERGNGTRLVSRIEAAA